MAIGVLHEIRASLLLVLLVGTSLVWPLGVGNAKPAQARRQMLDGVVQTQTSRVTAPAGTLLDLSGVPLRSVLAPWHMSWNNTIALCAIIRDEHMEDVTEWLQYYR